MSVAATSLPVTALLPLQSVGITPLEASLFVFVLITAVLTALFRDVLASIVVFAAYSLGLAVLYTFYRAPDVWLTAAALGAGALPAGEGGEWAAIREALEALDAPTTADELGIDDDTFLEAVTTAHTIRDRYTILGDGVSEDAAIEAATFTGVV